MPSLDLRIRKRDVDDFSKTGKSRNVKLSVLLKGVWFKILAFPMKQWKLDSDISVWARSGSNVNVKVWISYFPQWGLNPVRRLYSWLTLFALSPVLITSCWDWPSDVYPGGCHVSSPVGSSVLSYMLIWFVCFVKHWHVHPFIHSWLHHTCAFAFFKEIISLASLKKFV